MFYILILINLMYISCEFLFNFFLLNTASNFSTLDQIHSVEIMGRSLASFGFTLLFWKMIQNSNNSGRRKFFYVILVSFITYPSFYHLQGKLVDYLAESSTLSTKRQMNDLFLVKQGLINGSVQLSSIPYNLSIRDLPESKTFISSISLFMFNNNILHSYIEKNRNQIARHVFIAQLTKDPSQYIAAYEKVIAEIDVLYKKYEELEYRRQVEASKAQKIANGSFSDMHNKLKRKYRSDSRKRQYAGLSYASYVNTSSIKELIKDELRRRHSINIVSNFNPNNKASFVNAVVHSVNKEFAEINNRTKDEIGFVVPLGYNYRVHFYKDPAIIKLLSDTLGPLYFDGNFGSKAFRGLDIQGDRKMLQDNANIISLKLAHNFSHRDLNSAESISIVKAMIIPPIALIFSIFFAFLNLFILIKTIAMKVMKNKNKSNKISNYIVYGLLFILLVFPAVLNNKYTESKSYQTLYKTMKEYNPIMAFSANWILKFEPFIYGYGKAFLSRNNSGVKK